MSRTLKVASDRMSSRRVKAGGLTPESLVVAVKIPPPESTVVPAPLIAPEVHSKADSVRVPVPFRTEDAFVSLRESREPSALVV